MTPAVRALEAAGVAFTLRPYEHDPAAESYGEEAAEKLGVPPEQVFKTLVVKLDGKALALALVPAAARLDLKKLAAVAGAKKADMATPAEAERATGYVLGGISPFGTKRRLPAFIDESVNGLATVHVSAGRRGLQVELAPADLLALTGASVAGLCVG
jgi:Cys-tRNA(Pro)/Cys-tRNA(Cys) deacylase